MHYLQRLVNILWTSKENKSNEKGLIKEIFIEDLWPMNE